MRYGVFDGNEWLFPDTKAETGADAASSSLLRGQSGCFQVILEDVPVGQSVAWEAEGLDGVRVDVYREIPVCVNRNTNNYMNGALTTDDWDAVRRFRVRQAPYYTYDPLEKAEGIVALRDTEAFCVTLCPEADALPGLREGVLRIAVGDAAAAFPVSVRVHDAAMAEPDLHLTNWFSVANIARDHGLEYGSPAHAAMTDQYIRTLRECHQDIFWITWEDLTAVRVDGKPVFDFGPIRERVEFFLSRGFRLIEWSHILIRPNWEDPPFRIRDLTAAGDAVWLDCLSTAGRKYLAAFLEQLYALIAENGWQDISLVHISDEPKERCVQDYRILAGIFRKYLPGIRLMDAVEIYYIQDALDIYVPKNHYFQLNRNDFEDLRDARNEIWFYTCNMPGGKFLNRFLDNPLLHPRLLHWGNFAYDLAGYLHWGYNCIGDDQDPFAETSRSEGLPAGDCNIVYPGKDGPMISMRYLQMKHGVEDYTLLRMLEAADPVRARALCRKCFVAFDDYVEDAAAFAAVQEELVAAVAETR